MNPRIRNYTFGLLAMTLPLAACAQQPEAAAPIATRSATPAPQLVTGLPDFTQLVEQVGPGVVNIEADVAPKASQRRGVPDMDQMPEFFRRFFGPDFPGPGGQVPDPDSRGGRSVGSGFIISADGYVLTNHHVVDGADKVKVKLADNREFDAKVVGSDAQYDVALLKIDGKSLPFVRIGDSRTVKPGQWAVAIGSPLGLDHSVTAGIVSATGRSNPYDSDQRYVPFIQTDVAINQGNSGGPLLNTRGEVIGINSQIFSMSGGYMGISFAIPIDLAMNAVEQIRTTGKVSRGQLGVQVAPIDSLKAQGLGLPDSRGALVNDIVAGSAAGKAGVEAGDVIRSVNGTAVNAASDLPPLIGAMAPGTKVRLGILRDGKPREVTVTLTALEEGESQLAAANDDGAGPAAPQADSIDLLGLRVADLSAAERRQLGLEAGQGVRITAVESASARATQPALRPGMVILQVGRAKVGSVAELNRQLSGVKKGDVVMLLVRAGANTSFVAIRAGE